MVEASMLADLTPIGDAIPKISAVCFPLHTITRAEYTQARHEATQRTGAISSGASFGTQRGGRVAGRTANLMVPETRDPWDSEVGDGPLPHIYGGRGGCRITPCYMN